MSQINNNNKKYCVVIFLFALLCVPPVCAWGHDGHQIVAAIAQAFLTDQALAQVNLQLPPGGNLSTIATYPDSYDSTQQGAWSEHLHFVNLPVDAVDFTLWPTCEDGCVVTAIWNYTKQLRANFDSGRTQSCANWVDTEEPCPLSFVTHFVGDVHQPLHVAYKIDYGANEFSVTFLGQKTNLHHTWDTDMIVLWEHGGDWTQLAEQLIEELKSKPQVVADFQSVINEEHWANESFHFARLDAYNMSPGSRLFGPMGEGESEDQQLGDPSNEFDLQSEIKRRQQQKQQQQQQEEKKKKQESDVQFDWPDGFPIDDSTKYSDCSGSLGVNYYQKNIRVIKRRLSQAGVRLAALLNWIYDPQAE